MELWLSLWEYISSTVPENVNRTLLTIINCHLPVDQNTSNKYLLTFYYKLRGWGQVSIFFPLSLSPSYSPLHFSYLMFLLSLLPIPLLSRLRFFNVLSCLFNLNYRNLFFEPWQITSTKLAPLHNNYETGQNIWGTGQWAVQDSDSWQTENSWGGILFPWLFMQNFLITAVCSSPSSKWQVSWGSRNLSLGLSKKLGLQGNVGKNYTERKTSHLYKVPRVFLPEPGLGIHEVSSKGMPESSCC